MPAVGTAPVTVGDVAVITHSANATTTDTSYTYADAQDALYIFNKGVVDLQVTHAGVKTLVPPNQTFRIVGPTKAFSIKSTFGTQAFVVTSKRPVVKEALLTGLRVKAQTAPATATSAGTAGEIIWANGFLYVCVADNVWQRVALATW